MATDIFWTNVGVDIQTAISSAQTITNITKAAPPVITYTGADPANGDYVLLQVAGMTELHNRIFRLANVNAAANTAELEEQDSTLFSTFNASGTSTFQIITYGASFDTLMTFQSSGGELKMADTTTIHDQIETQAPTVASAFNVSADAKLRPTDPGWKEANKAFLAKQQRAMRLRFGTTVKMMFQAYCGASGIPTGNPQQIVQTKVTLSGQNMPTTVST